MNHMYFLLFAFGVLVLAHLVIDPAFARSDLDKCHIFEISTECDLSGFAHLIIGDMIIGGVLGIVFFIFTERNNRTVKSMIQSNNDMANHRRDFAVKNLKNTINVLLFTSGLIKKITQIYGIANYPTPKSELRDKVDLLSDRFDRLLQSARNGLIYSSDILDPRIIYAVEEACIFLNQITVQVSLNEMHRGGQNDLIISPPITKKLRNY